MKRIKIGVLIAGCLLQFFNLYSQTTDEVLQSLEDLELSSENAEIILDAVETRNNNLLHIYNINEMSREEMMLLGLNNMQITCLENYIQRTGQLYSINELKFINGFDEGTIEKISPYIYAVQTRQKHPLKIDSVLKYAQHSLRLQYVQNLKTPYGFTRNDGKGFEGSNFASVFRYKLKYFDRLEFSLVGDKDYGEPLYYKNKTYGYDRYNITLTLKDIGKHVKQITVGDYRLNIGEGLAMKQSFSLGYLSSYSGAKHSGEEITPLRSSSEYNYNKGIAAKFEYGKFDIVAFASYTPIDYNGKSIQQTGYHRTQTEISHKDSSAVAMAGSSVQYWNKGFNIGLTAFAYHFKDSIHKGTQAYQQYNFEGKNNSIIALNTSFILYDGIMIFSELAKSGNNAFAFLVGQQWTIGYKTAFSSVIRSYSPKYQNIYSDAIGVQSNNHNEYGLYNDLSLYWNKKLQSSFGLDLFWFPKESYRANKSAAGQKLKFQINYRPYNKHEFSFYLRCQNRQYNDTISNGTIEPCNNIILQPHLKYRYSYSDGIALVYRIGYSHSFTNDSKENYGFYNYLEFIARPDNMPFTFNLRWTYFRTTDYDNRFYVYEYTLPLSYSSSLLYNTGNKLYAMIGFTFIKNLKVYLRYNFTRYNNSDEISSGNTLIKGNLQHYIGGQIYYQFK